MLRANCSATTNDRSKTIWNRTENVSLLVVVANRNPDDGSDDFGTDLAQWNDSSVPYDMV